MAPNQTDGQNPRLSVTLPGNYKTALDYLADARGDPGNRVYTAELARDYIKEGLLRDVQRSDDVPGEVLDLLDSDLQANGGGDEFQ